MSNLSVHKTLLVHASVATAFRVFTQNMASWWPLETHHIGSVAATDVVLEPFAGGRWFERGEDGSECLWGHVQVFDSPRRVVLNWEISADWKHDPNIHTEVEVLFVPEGEGTRVTLEHRHLEAFGAKTDMMMKSFDSEGGWAGLLAAFGDQVDRHPTLE